ncbi:MAG: hypothetical protein WC729_01120 [Sphingomonas sp.]|uniref:hypothetical protein n=1 Tax=Sphingomonas sp. TaxID=28214 RepID=UPI003561AD49
MTMGRAISAVFVLLALAFLGLPQGARAESPEKVALIIVNTNYATSGLPNGDRAAAVDLSAALTRAGFSSVELIENADVSSLRKKIYAFRALSESAQVAIVSYSGVTVNSGGETFLLPPAAKIDRASDLSFEAIPIDLLSEAAGSAVSSVLLLDAVVGHPIDKSTDYCMTRINCENGRSRGLARVTSYRNSYAVYSAAKAGDLPRQTVARSFAERVGNPGVELSDMLNGIKGDLDAVSHGRAPVMLVGAKSTDVFLGSDAVDIGPFLPWPAPAPSSLGNVSSTLKLSGHLSDVDAQVQRRLGAKGYEELKYFSVPGGFAICTKLERINEDGSAAKDRWMVGKQASQGGFLDYFRKLIEGERGLFRTMVLVVTDQPIRPAGYQASDQDVKRWRSTGAAALGVTGKGVVRPGTQAWLLVYEFETDRSKNKSVRAVADAHLPFARHARAAGF